MIETELEKGDLIFFKNHYKKPNSDEIDYTYIDHVAMFAGYNELKHPLIIHCISNDNSPYHPELLSGLCITTLRALRNQLQHEDGYEDKYYDISFHVFRSKLNPLLALEALTILEQQARFRIPYDEQRIKEKLKREDEGMSDVDLQRLGEENYRTHGIYRSIKYASRFPLPLTRTRIDGIGRGLTCSMTVILAFQIAELRQKKLVSSISSQTDTPNAWISDKHCQEQSALPFPARYQAYLTDIKGTSIRTEPGSRPGYTCWTGHDCTPETFCHETFPIDAKTIGVAGLYLHMVEQNTTWHSLGELDVCTRHFSPIDKKQEKIKRRKSFIESLENLVDVTSARESIISSSRSVTPPPKPQIDTDQNKEPWFVNILTSRSGPNFFPSSLPHQASKETKVLLPIPTHKTTTVPYQ